VRRPVASPRSAPGALRTFLLVALLGSILSAAAPPCVADVILRDPRYTLRQIADSLTPLHPSQIAMDTACNFVNDGNIESIGVDPAATALYVQISDPVSSCLFEIDPVSGATRLITPGTGLTIIERGTDLLYDISTGFLLTADAPLGAARIVQIDPATGAVGTYAWLSMELRTLGMDISEGIGGTDVPAGDLVFTTDEMGNGIYQVGEGDPAAVLHATPPIAGDDMVIQPDGDWVHVGDFTATVAAYSPVHPHLMTEESLQNMQAIFQSAGLAFECGSRATVDDFTGEIFISWSCNTGGTGIFLLSEDLTTATLAVEIEPYGTEGLHDLVFGPASDGNGCSIYFTVHDVTMATEEVWELNYACGPGPPLCEAGGPYTAECAGPRTQVGHDGSASRSSDGSPLTFRWETDCPGGGFDDPASPTPLLTLDSGAAGLPLACRATLFVTDGQNRTSSCAAQVRVEDNAPPRLTCEGRIDAFTDQPMSAWVVVVAAADDDCDPDLDLSNDRTGAGLDASDDYPCGETLVTFTALDGTGNRQICRTTVGVTPPGAPTDVMNTLRLHKDTADPWRVVHLDWSLAAPRRVWEHYRVLRSDDVRAQPFPPIQSLPPWTATAWTDPDATGARLLFYDVRTADCEGNLSPDPYPPTP